MYGFYVSKITFLEYSKNLAKKQLFKPNTRTAVQGIPVLEYFFWYTVHVSTCAVVTFPCQLCTKTPHPAPRTPHPPPPNMCEGCSFLFIPICTGCMFQTFLEYSKNYTQK